MIVLLGVCYIHFGWIESASIPDEHSKNDDFISSRKISTAAFTKCKHEVNNLEENNPESKNAPIPKTPTSAVGFTAALGKDETYPNGARIEFPQVISNHGGAYVPQNSEFICPVRGMYQFTISIVSGYRANMEVGLFVNNGRRVSVRCDARDQGSVHAHCTNTVVIECQPSQKAWAQCLRDSGCPIHDNQNRFTTFSGVLLYQY